MAFPVIGCPWGLERMACHAVQRARTVAEAFTRRPSHRVFNVIANVARPKEQVTFVVPTSIPTHNEDEESIGQRGMRCDIIRGEGGGGIEEEITMSMTGQKTFQVPGDQKFDKGGQPECFKTAEVSEGSVRWPGEKNVFVGRKKVCL